MVYLIDTNIFLEILLEQKRADECRDLLDMFYEQNQPIIISLFSVHSILINLINRKKFEKAEEFVTKIKRSEHILVYRDDIEDHFEIIEICNDTKLDFDDGIQYYIAKKARCSAIISYDSDFDDLDIKRKTPDQLL